MGKEIRQIALYGKGGIGKSTITSNLAAIYAERGLGTMVIGCDPKSDCTRNLIGDDDVHTVSEIADRFRELASGIFRGDDCTIPGNYSGMLIGRPIAIMYFLARKITAECAEERRAFNRLFPHSVPLRTLRLNSLFGCSMLHVLGSSCIVKSPDSGFRYLSSYDSGTIVKAGISGMEEERMKVLKMFVVSDDEMTARNIRERSPRVVM